MSPRRLALLIACWLAVAVLLVRIAAGGALVGVMDTPSLPAIVVATFGVVLLGVAVVLIVGLVVEGDRAQALSVGAAVVTVGYGALLVVAGHESGALIAGAAALALLTGLTGRPSSQPSD
jgi:hypothetical protein